MRAERWARWVRVIALAVWGASVLVGPIAETWAQGEWVAAGSLNTAREFHTATLLPSGRVLVACGVHRLVVVAGEGLPIEDLKSAPLHVRCPKRGRR